MTFHKFIGQRHLGQLSDLAFNFSLERIAGHIPRTGHAAVDETGVVQTGDI